MPPDTNLTGLVERLLGPVASVDARPHPESTSFPLQMLRVSLRDGSELDLLLKDLRWSSLSGEAQHAKPEFLHDPAREIETYRQILSTASGGTASFYGAEGPLLLIENVDGRALWQIGELAVWCAAAQSISELHRDLASHVLHPCLVRYNANFYRLWLERAEALAGPLPTVARCHEDVVERLLSLPQTFIHGEYYASNIVVAGQRVCPVDWELAGAGPGLLDLAALTTGWPYRDQTAIAAAYGDVDEDDLDCCRLHLAVRWLGWSRTWSPPVAHARDWRAEALGAAERLGTRRTA
jgi:hypothetical protein